MAPEARNGKKLPKGTESPTPWFQTSHSWNPKTRWAVPTHGDGGLVHRLSINLGGSLGPQGTPTRSQEASPPFEDHGSHPQSRHEGFQRPGNSPPGWCCGVGDLEGVCCWRAQRGRNMVWGTLGAHVPSGHRMAHPALPSLPRSPDTPPETDTCLHLWFTSEAPVVSEDLVLHLGLQIYGWAAIYVCGPQFYVWGLYFYDWAPVLRLRFWFYRWAPFFLICGPKFMAEPQFNIWGPNLWPSSSFTA